MFVMVDATKTLYFTIHWAKSPDYLVLSREACCNLHAYHLWSVTVSALMNAIRRGKEVEFKSLIALTQANQFSDWVNKAD